MARRYRWSEQGPQRLTPLFEVRGKRWIVLLVLSIALALLGFLCTWNLRH